MPSLQSRDVFTFVGIERERGFGGESDTELYIRGRGTHVCYCFTCYFFLLLDGRV